MITREATRDRSISNDAISNVPAAPVDTSYAGLLLIVAGFGAALGNWLSLTVCVVLPLPAILWRIHVEEAELNHVLGEAYRTYQSDRARLIPRLW